MEKPTRRQFLRTATAVSASAATLGTLKAAGANERITVGVVGMSRGRMVARELANNGAKIAYVCDVDDARVRRAQNESKADHAVTDFRKILDDKSVDAVVVATPDHWHVPAALLACAAGKHVYVEKPCSHNVHEGRLLVEAARRTKRVVQVGSQSRSTAFIREAIDIVRGGAIGSVLMAKAWNSQRRVNIGHVKPSEPPAGFDYDLWVGPAPMQPYQKNRYHYTWHWWYDFGTGDAGNDGIHELDIARWGLGDPGHPTVVSGHGSKLHFDDDQQFPDTQYVTFEYPGDGSLGSRKVMIYEQRIWSPYVQEGLENGNAFYGTEGMLILGKGVGWKLYGPKNKLLKEAKGTYDLKAHTADFLDAIRTGRKPNADIEIGHRSAVLAHLSNILARAGRGSIKFDPATEGIVGDAEAAVLLKRTYREGHWAAPQDA